MDDRELAWGLIGERMLFISMDGSVCVNPISANTEKIYSRIKLGRQSCLDPDDTVDGHLNKNQVMSFTIKLSILTCEVVRVYNILYQIIF